MTRLTGLLWWTVCAFLICGVGCGSTPDSNDPPVDTEAPEVVPSDIDTVEPPDVPLEDDTADGVSETETLVPDGETVEDAATDGNACAPCTEDDDCVDGICRVLPNSEITFCTRTCLDGCPGGFSCTSFLDPYCIPDAVGGLKCVDDDKLLVENICGHQYEIACPAGVQCNPSVCQTFGTVASCVETPAPDGDECKCNATCSGGVCGGDIQPAGSCLGIINCIAVFDNPAECLDVCSLGATAKAQTDFEIFTACIGGCGFATEIQTCVAEQCFSEMQGCIHEGKNGTGSCSDIMLCGETCNGVQSCAFGCIESGTLNAQEFYYLMQNCLIDACGTFPTTACADEAAAGICATKITTCVDN